MLVHSKSPPVLIRLDHAPIKQVLNELKMDETQFQRAINAVTHLPDTSERFKQRVKSTTSNKKEKKRSSTPTAHIVASGTNNDTKSMTPLETIRKWLSLSTLAILEAGDVEKSLHVLGILDPTVIAALMKTALNLCEENEFRANTFFAQDPMGFMESLFVSHFKHLIPSSAPTVIDRTYSITFKLRGRDTLERTTDAPTTSPFQIPSAEQ